MIALLPVPLRVTVRALLFLIICVLIIIVQWPMLRVYRGRYSFIAPRWWQAASAAIFGVKIIRKGTPYADGQTLYISNHISYIDIPTLGSIVRGVFVARGDLANWPVFGFLGTLQQTAFISRDRKNARAEKENLERLIAEGKNLILFAEGTSTDGTSVIPFKSSLFSLLFNEDGSARDIKVQPVTIHLLSVDGQPVENGAGPIRDKYTWHGDMELEPHLKNLARGKGAVVEITFHPALNPADYGNDRKAIAADCYKAVTGALPALASAA